MKRSLSLLFSSSSSSSSSSPHHRHIHISHMLMTIILLLWASCSMLGSFTVSASRTCPRDCLCNDTALIVHCHRTALLDYVPHTLNPAVRELYLAHNNIRQIKSSFEFYKNLGTLDLTANGLQALGEKNFATNSKLERLILAENNVSSIQQYSFTGLTTLKTLDLSQNLLESIESGVFQPLKSLQVLDLSNNQINHFDEDAFAGLSALIHLNLSNNHIAQLSAQVFVPLSALINMNLSSNALSQLDNDQFQALAKLETLDISSCVIENVQPLALRGLNSLKFFSLHSNHLQNIPSSAFPIGNRIEVLNLGSNLYDSIPDQAFINLKKLTFLYLSNNTALADIHTAAFEGLDSLQFLEMSSNPSLTHLDRRIFDRLFSLSSLVLSNNNFTGLEVDLITRFKHDLYLDVRDNPFNCNCSLEWLNFHFIRMFNRTIASDHAFLSANNLTAPLSSTTPAGSAPISGSLATPSFPLLHSLLANNISDLIIEQNAMDVKCAAPFALENKLIIKLHKDKFGCFVIESFVPIAIGGLFGAFIVAGVVALSIIRCKYQLTGFVKTQLYTSADQKPQQFDLYQRSEFVFVPQHEYNSIYGPPAGNNNTTSGKAFDELQVRYPMRMTPITEL